MKCAFRPASIASFAQQECEGSSAVRVPLDTLGKYAVSRGHRLWQTGPYVWCRRCGCFTSRRLRGLAELCGVRKASVQARDNLAAGKRPAAKRSEPEVGRPVRLTVAKWLEWRFLSPGVGASVEDYSPKEVAARLAEDAVTTEGRG